MLFSRTGAKVDGRAGRSGEIRTHDPQHPMLMRYQAALRSDRAVLATAIIAGQRRRRNAGPAGPVPQSLSRAAEQAFEQRTRLKEFATDILQFGPPGRVLRLRPRWAAALMV